MSTRKADDWLTTPQVASLLGVSTQSIREWVTAGRIRAECIMPPVGRMYLLLNKQDVEQVRWERGPHGHGQG